MASGNDRRHSIKKLIAGLLSAAIFWLILPGTSPTNFNNQEPSGTKPTVKATVEPAMQRAEAIPVKTEPVGETAKVEEVAVKPQPTPEPQTPPVADNESEAKAFIYHKESGNNPAATNSIGCYGIGQDCNGVVKNKCGADYACQDEYFTSYMLRRYGSWASAKQFWLNRTPIDGRDVGHWW